MRAGPMPVSNRAGLLWLVVILLAKTVASQTSYHQSGNSDAKGNLNHERQKYAGKPETLQEVKKRVWPKLAPELREYLDFVLTKPYRKSSRVGTEVSAPPAGAADRGVERVTITTRSKSQSDHIRTRDKAGNARRARSVTRDDPLPPISLPCVEEVARLLLYNASTADGFELTAMLDATGKAGSGLYSGDTKVWGSYSECAPFFNITQYCLVTANLVLMTPLSTAPLGFRPFEWGLCVPKNCTEQDVATIFALGSLSGTILEQYVIEPNTNVTAVCTKPEPWLAREIAAIFICALLGLLAFIGTVMDWAQGTLVLSPKTNGGVRPPSARQAEQYTSTPFNDQTVSDSLPLEFGADSDDSVEDNVLGADESTRLLRSSPSGGVPCNQDGASSLLAASDLPEYTSLSSPHMRVDGQSHDGEASELIESQAEARRSIAIVRVFDFLKRLCLCFSLPRNGRRLLDTTVPDGTITSLNGVRVLSISWVILGHTHFLSLEFISNPLKVVSVLERFTFQTVSNAFFAVDSFFLISGLLVMYLTLKQLDNSGGRLPWFKYYFHRIWRLTPSYMIALMILYNLAPRFGEGPAWTSVKSYTYQCKDYWWTNLLYINNFHPSDFDAQCISWTWYLANDMQFYIISPIFLILMHRSKAAGTIALSAGMGIYFTVTLSLAATYHFPIGTKAGNSTGYDQNYNSMIYEKPYCRISAYLIGLFLGALLRRGEAFTVIRAFNKMRRTPRVLVVMAGWSLSVVLFMSPLFGLYEHARGQLYLTHDASVVYIAFSRPAWALALAWVIWACHNGYGGSVNSLLSFRFWIPLSRLTYSVYLIHLMVILIGYGSLDSPFVYTDNLMVFFFLAFLFMAHLVATVFYLIAEAPLLELEKLMFRR